MDQQVNNNHMPPLAQQAQTRMHDAKHDLFRQPAESRKHALPTPDIAVGMFDRLDRPFKLPLYPPPSYAQARDAALSFSPTQKTELAPIKSASDKSDDTGEGNTEKNNNNSANNQTLPSLSTITA